MKEKINANNLPRHVAVIMDGNGRWAKSKGAARIFGHRSAIQAVRDVTEGCAELGVGFLTLYAFSTENWGRPPAEVNALMQPLVETISGELKTLMKNNVQLRTIGATDQLPDRCRRQLREAIELTQGNTGLVLILALNYSGRWEITEAVKQIVHQAQREGLSAEDIDQQTIADHLSTREIPDPELLIRTSGEMRISNFLLWQLAYTELYITSVLWPDFRREDLYKAILAYQQRERRFGKISEQV